MPVKSYEIIHDKGASRDRQYRLVEHLVSGRQQTVSHHRTRALAESSRRAREAGKHGYKFTKRKAKR